MPASAQLSVNPSATARGDTDSVQAPICYAITDPSIVVAAPLTTTASGTLAGTVHITSENLASAMGIACADLAQNVTSVSFADATSNVAEHVGISLFLGDPVNSPSTSSSFATHDRVCAAYHGADVQAVHGMINPAAGNGNVAITPNAGKVRCAFDNVHDTVHTAATRTAKYGGLEAITSENFAESCTAITGADGEKRWMVPQAGFGTCPVSKLISNNITTNPEFCNGRYSGSKAAIVNDLKGRPCTVVTSGDFDTVSTAFWRKCTPSGAFSNGITARFETMTALGDEHTAALADFAGRPPSVSAKLVFERPTTAATLGTNAAEIMNPHTQHFTTAASMTGGGGKKGAAAPTIHDITQAVLAAKIAPAVTSSKASLSASSTTGTVTSTSAHMAELVDAVESVALSSDNN